MLCSITAWRDFLKKYVFGAVYIHEENETKTAVNYSLSLETGFFFKWRWNFSLENYLKHLMSRTNRSLCCFSFIVVQLRCRCKLIRTVRPAQIVNFD